MDTSVTPLDLKIRYLIYHFFAENCKAPSYHQVADLLKVDTDSVRSAYHRLHEHHLIFLDPGTGNIRMANPFSAIPTTYKVRSGAKEWWANCAWDTLGIVAALNIDAQIEAIYPDNRDLAEFHLRGDSFDGRGHVVYFPLPFRHWYDDLIYT
jgi:DNA-binding transcriptional MocR family regulator